MRFFLLTVCLSIGVLLAPTTIAQGTIDTEKAPATDSEGVGPGSESDAKNKAGGTTTVGGTQTWGGGPKSGQLHEDWRAWILAIKDAPKGFIPLPPTSEPAPKDPLECGRVMSFYYNNSDELQDDKTLRAMEDHMKVPCKPAG